MKIIVTGAAGFIGFHVTKQLLKQGHSVIGIDNLNDYYSPHLKYDRLKQLQNQQRFLFTKRDINNGDLLVPIFNYEKPEVVIHLAAQAGVCHSFDHPYEYFTTNLLGFGNILELCRQYKVKQFIYASSSSVYGRNADIPFSIEDNTNAPINLYAATKKSNELMAYSYSHLYGLKTTGIRYFTVYGPWGRPDMSIFLFSEAITNDIPIYIHNKGEMKRDFTYIDDAVKITIGLLDVEETCSVFNIGNNKPIHLLHMISLLEKYLGKKAEKIMIPMQPGEMLVTYADMKETIKQVGFGPCTSIEIGLEKFTNWYKSYRLGT